MRKLRPLEEISKQDSGDLLLLRLEYSENNEDERENTCVAGYRWRGSDTKFHSQSGRGNTKFKTFSILDKLAVDISDGTYLGSKILGYEVVRKYRPLKK